MQPCRKGLRQQRRFLVVQFCIYLLYRKIGQRLAENLGRNASLCSEMQKTTAKRCTTTAEWKKQRRNGKVPQRNGENHGGLQKTTAECHLTSFEGIPQRKIRGRGGLWGFAPEIP